MHRQLSTLPNGVGGVSAGLAAETRLYEGSLRMGAKAVMKREPEKKRPPIKKRVLTTAPKAEHSVIQEREVYRFIGEVVAAVTQTHKQAQQDFREIERLRAESRAIRAETKAILSKLKAAA